MYMNMYQCTFNYNYIYRVNCYKLYIYIIIYICICIYIYTYALRDMIFFRSGACLGHQCGAADQCSDGGIQRGGCGGPTAVDDCSLVK